MKARSIEIGQDSSGTSSFFSDLASLAVALAGFLAVAAAFLVFILMTNVLMSW